MSNYCDKSERTAVCQAKFHQALMCVSLKSPGFWHPGIFCFIRSLNMKLPMTNFIRICMRSRFGNIDNFKVWICTFGHSVTHWSSKLLGNSTWAIESWNSHRGSFRRVRSILEKKTKICKKVTVLRTTPSKRHRLRVYKIQAILNGNDDFFVLLLRT